MRNVENGVLKFFEKLYCFLSVLVRIDFYLHRCINSNQVVMNISYYRCSLFSDFMKVAFYFKVCALLKFIFLEYKYL